MKALSPSVNDPTTATTCIGYIEAILERIASMPAPAPVRRYAKKDVTMVMRGDTFDDYLEALIQVSRYATSDARAVEALLHATLQVAEAAANAGSEDRARAAAEAGARIERRAAKSDAIDAHEREAIAAVLERFPVGQPAH